MTFSPGADPSVDILINNYNYAAFLPHAIESALEQDYPSVHVIVVDDGSTDASRELLQAYENTIEVVLKENGGQASAINAGLARCRGEIVMVLDADDMLKRPAASRVAAAFAEDDRVTKVQFRMEVVDAAGHPTGETKPPPEVAMPQGDVRAAELAFPFDLPWLGCSGNSYRLAPLRRILPIPEHAYPVRGADWYLIHLATLLGSVVSLPEVSGSYRLHGANGYHPRGPTIDLRYVRETIGYCAVTAGWLSWLADELNLQRPERILSFAELANRLVSLKLEPDLHPVPRDHPRRLFGDAVRAVGRRSDLTWPRRAAFVAWFAGLAVAPRPLSVPLAEFFVLTGRRRTLRPSRRESRPAGAAAQR